MNLGSTSDGCESGPRANLGSTGSDRSHRLVRARCLRLLPRHDDMRGRVELPAATSEAVRMVATGLSGLVDKHRSGQLHGAVTAE